MKKIIKEILAVLFVSAILGTLLAILVFKIFIKLPQ